MRFQAAVRHSSDQLLQFGSLGAGEQRDAGAFDRGVADLKDFRIGNVRNQADALRGLNVQMAAKSAREIKNIRVIERIP